MLTTLVLQPARRGLLEFTEQVQAVVGTANAADGLCTLFVRHTSASLLIQENADPDVQRDLEAWIGRLVPEGDPLYRHTAEGPDDMPGHVRSMLTATSLAIPFAGRRLLLGRWQGIYLWEHRRSPSPREVVVHLGP
jgi:secondary thiamine-phosphate synthase enzyme